MLAPGEPLSLIWDTGTSGTWQTFAIEWRQVYKRNMSWLKLKSETELERGKGVYTTSCMQPAALSGAHLARCPLPLKRIWCWINSWKRVKDYITMVEEGGMSGWRQVGLWREGGREVVGSPSKGGESNSYRQHHQQGGQTRSICNLAGLLLKSAFFNFLGGKLESAFQNPKTPQVGDDDS